MKKFLSVLLAVMMVLSTVSFAAPSAVTILDTEADAAVVETAPEEEAELAKAITDNTDHGELVFELNFDNLANGTTVANNAKLNTLGATLNPNFAKAQDLYLVLSQYGNAVIENGALKAVKTGTGRWPQIQVSVGTKNSLVDNGIIYMEADMKLDLADTQTATVSLGLTGYREALDGVTEAGTGSQASVQTVYNPTDESWYTLKGAYALNDADGYTGLECVIFIPTYSATSSEMDYFYVDNLRLYYKPFNVDVTVNCAGKSTVVSVPTTEATSIASLVDAANVSILYSVTGAVIDGENYSLNDSVVFTKDTTVEVALEKVDDKYISSQYGLMLFDIDFENHNLGDAVGNSDASFNIGNYVTPIGERALSHDASNWHLNGVYMDDYVLSVLDDPANSGNNVLGVKGITSSIYPGPQINTYSNSTMSRYGFIEDDNIIYTIEYDFYDTTADGTAIRFGGRSSICENEGLTKWTSVEDVPVETSYNRAASTWYKNTGVMNLEKYSRMGGSDEISFVKMHSASPQNADLYWDNIRLYYRPASVDVTIADCALEGVTVATPVLSDVSTSTTVSALLTSAGVDYSAVSSLSYVFRGVSLDAEGTTVYGLNDTIALYEDSTLYLIFEEVDLSEWSDEHGILLFDIDFEDSRAASVLTANTGNKDYYLTEFAKVNPYIAGNEKWAFSTSGMDLIGIENGAVKLQWDGTGRWPQILIGNPKNDAASVLMGENGTYYVHAEYKVLDSLDPNLTSIAVTANGLKNGAHQSSSGILPLGNSFYTSSNQVLVDEWMTIEGGKSTWDNDADGLDNDDINKITTVFTHGTTTGTPGGYYLMDNIKLWWKPAKVDVTIVGGQNADFETVTLEDVSTSSTVDQLIALIPGATSDFGKITGLATEDGEKLDTLDIASDVTLQALWTPWVIVDGGQEFATDAKGISGGGSGQWSGSYGNTNEIGNGGSGNVTAAISWMYSNGWYTSGGNLFNVQDTVAIGESNASLGTATWATPAVHSITDMIRENVNTTLAAGNDAEYVLVKYRYDNLPNLAEVYANDPNPEGYKYTLSADGNSLTYYDRTGATQTFEMAPDYGKKIYIQCQDGSYQYGGGQEFRQNELMVEDVWYYDLLPVTATMQTKGVKCVIIQTYNRFDGQITEYDYVRFVKLGDELDSVVPEQPAPEYAPESSNETSYRLNAPNGIRFKADITAEVNTLASDYGWVVGRAAKGATEETLVIGAASTVTAYGREDGVDVKNFFAETDELKTFTAVVYNIPAGNEDDVLCIKPFVKVDGEVYYGAMISKTPRQVAEAHGIDVSVLMKNA